MSEETFCVSTRLLNLLNKFLDQELNEIDILIYNYNIIIELLNKYGNFPKIYDICDISIPFRDIHLFTYINVYCKHQTTYKIFKCAIYKDT
jgi:hypothetical protein